MTRILVDNITSFLVCFSLRRKIMVDVWSLSERLRNVLKDLEKITDDFETIQAQAQDAANDDFLTRQTATPQNDN